MINKLKKAIKDPKGSLVWIFSKMNFIPDIPYLKIRYRIVMGRKLNLKNPVTYNEKLNWMKIYDRNPEYKNLACKYEVRKYIADTIGEEYLIPLLGVWDKWDDIDFDKLPEQFVLKCTHDSGSVVICKDKKTFDYESAKAKITKKQKKNMYWWAREWVYKDLKPRIIAEQYMKDGEDEDLRDYKFMCFGGKVKCIFTCSERFQSGLRVTFFDNQWNRLPFERHYKASECYIPKPKNLQRMIELSETLSRNMHFVRVDFYEVNGKIYFGEMTFFPGAGFEEFTPEEWDKTLGDWIIL